MTHRLRDLTISSGPLPRPNAEPSRPNTACGNHSVPWSALGASQLPLFLATLAVCSFAVALFAANSRASVDSSPSARTRHATPCPVGTAERAATRSGLRQSAERLYGYEFPAWKNVCGQLTRDHRAGMIGTLEQSP